MAHNVDEILSRQLAEMRSDEPRRTLVLHTEPRPLRRRIAFASSVAAAAAIIVAVVMVALPTDRIPASSDDIICWVDGSLITDRQAVEAHTCEALTIINDNLRKPVEDLSAEIDDSPAMRRVGEMLREIGAGSDI